MRGVSHASLPPRNGCLDGGVHPAANWTLATAETLRAALSDLVADAEVARRSALLRADARAEGGTSRAADLIENMLA